MRFAKEYCRLTDFVNEYLEGKLSPLRLLWLQQESFSRKLQILIKDPNGEIFHFLDHELFKKLKKVPLSKFQVVPRWKTVVTERISSQDPFPYYGLLLRPLFYEIYDELANLLKGRYKINRCAYWNCDNIFWKSRITHKYCSPGHRSIVSSTRYHHKRYRKYRNY